jgi:DNA helicase HerA-like ATPase
MSRDVTFDVAPKIFVSKQLVFGTEHKAKDCIFLGRIAERGVAQDVWFDVSSEHVVAIVGKRGSGKSYTLGVMAESIVVQDPKISSTNTKKAVLLFDTLGIFWMSKYAPKPDMKQEDIAMQVEKLREWNLDINKPVDVQILVPAGFESTSMPHGTKRFYLDVSEMNPSDWAFLLGIDLFRDAMGILLNVAYAKVTTEGWYNEEAEKEVLPNPRYGIDDLTSCILNDKELCSEIIGFDVRTRRALVSKLNSFMKFPVFAKIGTSMQDLLKAGVLTILLLSDVPDDIRCVISSVIFRKVLSIRREVSFKERRRVVGELKESDGIEKVPHVWLMIDEAQNISPAEAATISTPTLVKLVREGRNFGISLAITTQQPTAIDQRIMAQVDTLVIHKLSVKKDIDSVLSNSKTLSPENIYLAGKELSYQDLVRKLPTGYALVSNSETPREFILRVRPRISVHGGFEA